MSTPSAPHVEKRPFVLLEDRGLLGFKEDEWKAAFR
jgi:hypothetical protein